MNSPIEDQLGAALRDLASDPPFTPDVAAIEHRARRARRRGRVLRGGMGAGVVAVAAVTAVSVASSAPSAPAQADGGHPAAVRASASASAPAAAPAPLMQLAASVASEPHPAGDATLVERETTLTGHSPVTVWDLYTDDGRYFFAKTRSGLPAQVQADNNQGDGIFKREIEAAHYAQTGNLKTAALRMAWAANTDPVPAWLRAQLGKMSDGGLQIDNYVWENSEDALVAGSGDPQVRAGVLRLVSALPGVSVTRGTLDGQPTLTFAAGAAEFGRYAPGGAHEATTINAQTGIPLKFTGSGTSVTWHVTRVSLADVKAGKF